MMLYHLEASGGYSDAMRHRTSHLANAMVCKYRLSDIRAWRCENIKQVEKLRFMTKPLPAGEKRSYFCSEIFPFWDSDQYLNHIDEEKPLASAFEILPRRFVHVMIKAVELMMK